MITNQQMIQQFWMDCFRLGFEIAATPNPPNVYDESCEIIDPKKYAFEYATEMAASAIQTFNSKFNSPIKRS
jgi:hypothetical protein